MQTGRQSLKVLDKTLWSQESIDTMSEEYAPIEDVSWKKERPAFA